MPIEDFLLPVNAGKQAWQVLRSNMTSGDHPYNFKGMCQALVSQWFLEVRFAAGKQPDELGRYLLNANLGPAGYSGIAKSQDAKLDLDVHSGGALRQASGLDQIPAPNAAACAMIVLTLVYDVDTRNMQSETEVSQAIDLKISGGHPQVFTAQLSLSGINGWMLSKLIGATWGHAIGIHCNGVTLYVFDPNYGVFTIRPVSKINVTSFFQNLWGEYSPSAASLAPVRALAID